MDNNKVLNAINQLSTSSDKSNDSSICSLKSKKMHKNLNTIVLLAFLLNSCSFPTTKEAGIQYSTKPAFVSSLILSITWEKPLVHATTSQPNNLEYSLSHSKAT